MISDKIADFLSYMEEQCQMYDIARDMLKECDEATQDILHKMEIDPVKYKERARLATKLQSIRRQRRTAKDMTETTKIISIWVKDNKSIIGSLQRLLGDVRKAEKKQQNRTYIPRTNVIEEIRRI
ncbi:hypothetical protein [Monoglobus pectinilyticus]|jgi:hypothetical protein|uniref:Uncharacterized protein n=1 Tax=Monoglobus pectinilyticus TaxID=1981510 RepID=A0A2K9P3S0_9FIRM|nr:hypothetical protein [Monoglobus pectinilyticus]AUO19905.1 hypothetical protein B9O19_01751 [Monoglobus pectinilyticus]